MLNDLPDELPNTMSPTMTLALFNAWCEEQGLNPTHIIWYIIARLQGRVYKKIGLFLHGQSNSGKTYWSTILFSSLHSIVGKLSTGGRFCLQDCERKRIIIGEELAITLDNVDRLKELMNGDITTCERKGKSVVKCKANLVVLNSNSPPGSNVPAESQALINRMMVIRNLKPSAVLGNALSQLNKPKPHPKFLTLFAPPTDSQLRDMEKNSEIPTDILPLDEKRYMYKESWDSICEEDDILQATLACQGSMTEAEPIILIPDTQDFLPQSMPALTPETTRVSFQSTETDCPMLFDCNNF
ncbi:hypothetical protein ElyMa_000495000 [Elysia marginata]|uniref:NrS-1 polymerase-like helicase domain-containing protein n=1 Tax=Elysia marginata TaxID=1093978 RepID=A0AAV4FTT0_9GAST|nr:hypothetical protein ElyMa_000495000 [Elysia marginata]